MAVADDSDIEKVYLDGEAIEVVEKFCYLGDTIGAQGGTGAGVMARVRRGWSKFRELLPLLTSRALPLLTKGRVYQACVRSVMMYGSETWPVRNWGTYIPFSANITTIYPCPIPACPNHDIPTCLTPDTSTCFTCTKPKH
ncbi:hypothetical protein Pcinc_012702 [Petrolisthes cinctipes]|uniref:Uncharacterized protein n=1 Tax=Petrolisthes cinctipes TaxID=88211 RepID=A0AAE1G458_PETCI|nr:hypothetical protein Pcinc_012702 [Petrolisthes cinctipes]